MKSITFGNNKNPKGTIMVTKKSSNPVNISPVYTPPDAKTWKKRPQKYASGGQGTNFV